MTLNFNDAEPQRSFEVIPANTVATLHLNLRSGGAGPDGWLRRSKDGNSEAVDCEFTVVGGPFEKRKFWTLLTVAGTTPGHAQAAEISRARTRAILESARGIRPDDQRETAQQGRQIASYRDLDGLRFIGRIGVEPPKDGYAAKNILLEVITPERKEWHAVEQAPKAAAHSNGSFATTPTPPPTAKIEKPQWAR
jgi:hypothetical protein